MVLLWDISPINIASWFVCGVCVYERERHTDRQRLISKMRPDDFMKKRMINVRSEFIEMHTKGWKRIFALSY